MATIDPTRLVKLGNYANDGTGDDLRTAFEKVNSVVAELWGDAAISDATNLGGGTGLYAGKNSTNLEFKTLTSNNDSIVFTNTSTEVDLQAKTVLANDATPMLGANLLLNGFDINGQNGTGDVKSTVFGYDISLLNAVVQLLLESNSSTLNVDFGTNANDWTAPGSETNPPNGYLVDLGQFTLPPPANQLNFGTFV